MPKKILIIDDEAAFTYLVKLNLEKTGKYDVRVENKGALGLPAAIEFKPDMIFLDIVMPDMDGSDVAMQLSENPVTRDVPVVFLTAIVEKEEVDDNDSVIGGRKFLAKPVKVDELINCIEGTLRK